MILSPAKPHWQTFSSPRTQDGSTIYLWILIRNLDSGERIKGRCLEMTNFAKFESEMWEIPNSFGPEKSHEDLVSSALFEMIHREDT